jgi:hypothetical protein
MPTLDIWSNSATWRIRGLVQSIVANLLLAGAHEKTIYICSPWISDFEVFDNTNGQFSSLVPGVADRARINLSDCLVELSNDSDVRIVTRDTPPSRAFLAIPKLGKSKVAYRLSDDKLHEKGFLTPLFYLEGSMNITYSGVVLNSEKVVFHSGTDTETKTRFQNAYLEFDRRWEHLQ